MLRASPQTRVDLIDRLPTPYGLVRSGVAPDHQSTKGVTRVLDRVLAKPEVAFFGGVEVGRDVSLDELRGLYDAVVIATGAALDRRLDVPGEDLPGVFSSGRFIGWYNAHPDHADIDVRAVATAVVIGSGNVALDVARVLAKAETEFAGSDLSPDAGSSLANSGVARIHIVGRSPAAAMKFSEAELLEFGELARARPRLGLHADLGDTDGKSAAALRAVVASADGSPSKTVEVIFEFGLVPLRFEGDRALERVRFRDTVGVEHVREAQLAVTCIGYATHGLGLALDGGAIRNVEGRIADGLFVVGWAKRGPSGTIPTNRSEAHLVAKAIVAGLSGDETKPGRDGLVALLRARNCEPLDYADWRRIDASEIARAGADRLRHKWRSHAELVTAARVRA
jgi:ferredoxin--NADP+ reductase